MKITDKALKWFANACMAIGAIQVSFVIEWATRPWAFLGFLAGHIIWSYTSFIERDWPLFFLNIAFLFLDTYAIIIRL